MVVVNNEWSCSLSCCDWHWDAQSFSFYLYEKAITINPDYFEARLSYGSFLSEKMGLHDYALIQYAEMLRIRPESFELIDSLKLRLVKISKIKKCLIGRNDLCFCGSGKKFKKCHGK